jgi:16S rRNA (guanine966-N2)-methyltransferase
MATRPTTDRVREALFGVLGDIEGTRAMDCYAGTGALGFEALSRGATNATFIESGKNAAAMIRKNADTLGLSDRVTLLQCPVERASNRLQGNAADGTGFDLVLADPPWPIYQAAALAVLELVRTRLNEGATVALGHPTREQIQLPNDRGWVLIQTRHWGDSAFTLLRREAKA